MPLLPKEVEIAPDEIFDLHLDWYVAHVRSRQEKLLARFLAQRGIAFYLPQTEKALHGGGRVRSSWLPLFPGYVFFRGDGSARDAVVRSDLAVTVLDVDDQRLLNGELRQIRQLQLSGASLIPYDDIVPGEPVRITEGVFAGYDGVVERNARGARLLVSISLLRRHIAVEFPRAVLKRRRF